VSAPDYEVPTDEDGNNSYDVTVTVSDGTLSESQSIAVTVTDVNEGGTTPFIINGTKKNDQIVVQEGADGWLSVRINGRTSQVQLQQGQEIHVFGLNGDDRITLEGLTRNALVDGGNGNDQIDASGVTSPLVSLVLQGGNGHDRIIGGVGDDLLEGGNGKDVLVGNEGDDRLLGGNGKDLLIGGLGDDVLEGNNGNDSLLGGPGRDRLDGGNGKDLLIGGSEDEVVDGGHGRDLVLMLDQDALAKAKQAKLLSTQPAWLRQFVG